MIASGFAGLEYGVACRLRAVGFQQAEPPCELRALLKNATYNLGAQLDEKLPTAFAIELIPPSEFQ